MQLNKKLDSTANTTRAQYAVASEYTPNEIIQTGFLEAKITKAYTTYVTSPESTAGQTTVVFNDKSEERVRTLNANKRMASWVNR
jgi:hypothetical protein